MYAFIILTSMINDTSINIFKMAHQFAIGHTRYQTS